MVDLLAEELHPNPYIRAAQYIARAALLIGAVGLFLLPVWVGAVWPLIRSW